MGKRWVFGLLFLGLVIAAGSWVIAQQGTTPPPAAAPAVAPAASPAVKATLPPASLPEPTPPANVQVPNLSPFPPPPPPPAGYVAATVNGQNIPEMSVYRAIVQGERINNADVRKEVLGVLVENALVDQYLVALKVDVGSKDVEDALAQLKKEAADQKEDFSKILESLKMTEEELRLHMLCTLRWDKFVADQSTDKALRDFFDKNKNMFDGSRMQVRHILVSAGEGAAGQEAAKARIAVLKKQIDDEVAQETAKLPAQADADAKEKERCKILERVFAQTARKESACLSKEQGGDIGGWFPRLGECVEPFARAAFALKPHQMSDAVFSEFGCHLILAVDAQAGKEVKYDEMKPFVQRVYAARLREAVVAQMRTNAKIVINPPPKEN